MDCCYIKHGAFVTMHPLRCSHSRIFMQAGPGYIVVCRVTVSGIVSVAFPFSALRRCHTLNISNIPMCGDAFLAAVVRRLTAGKPWPLQGLLMAYTGVSAAGLVDLDGLLRICAPTMKILVLSGMALHAHGCTAFSAAVTDSSAQKDSLLRHCTT